MRERDGDTKKQSKFVSLFSIWAFFSTFFLPCPCIPIHPSIHSFTHPSIQLEATYWHGSWTGLRRWVAVSQELEHCYWQSLINLHLGLCSCNLSGFPLLLPRNQSIQLESNLLTWLEEETKTVGGCIAGTRDLLLTKVSLISVWACLFIFCLAFLLLSLLSAFQTVHPTWLVEGENTVGDCIAGARLLLTKPCISPSTEKAEMAVFIPDTRRATKQREGTEKTAGKNQWERPRHKGQKKRGENRERKKRKPQEIEEGKKAEKPWQTKVAWWWEGWKHERNDEVYTHQWMTGKWITQWITIERWWDGCMKGMTKCMSQWVTRQWMTKIERWEGWMDESLMMNCLNQWMTG